jgi:hypothetical protein
MQTITPIAFRLAEAKASLHLLREHRRKNSEATA